MTMPVCPRCGQPPIWVLDEGRQAFCGTPSCEAIAWNPTQSAEELEANKKEITLPETRLAGTKALLIQPNGDYEFRQITGLDDLHAAIGSTDMDWSAPGPVTYYCFGHALYESPRNMLATVMYHRTHDTTDPLCGPVVVAGPPEDQNDTDVPEAFVEAFLGLKESVSQEVIDATAVPLTDAEQHEFQMKMIAAQGQAREAIKQGRAVDFGGLMMGPEGAFTPPPGWASTTLAEDAEMDALWNAALGDCGQHRMRGSDG